MKPTICPLQHLNCPHNTSVALGTFDGLHLGHRAVIEAACNQPNLSSVVFSVVAPRKDDLLITSNQSEQLLSQMNVDYLVPTPLEEIRHLPPDAFFEKILLQKLKAKQLVCGFNFRFGSGAVGDISLLKKLCNQHQIALTVIQPVKQEGQPISSSRIRLALKEGNLALANQMLGRSYGFESTILQGQHLGRQLGFPTINQAVPAMMTTPKNGVYAVQVQVDENTYGGVCNIGRHPTVGNLKAPLAETYLFDFSGNLYGKTAQLSFVSFLRAEQTFHSLEALQAAIANDAKQAKEILF
ncbi:MAG: bifunctional riboflavin kinase/FAD synthetase [Clostridia bacterium]|nr:bifunctional riboflavin kinase/FAD synthetase [Clostridia bacterium]